MSRASELSFAHQRACNRVHKLEEELSTLCAENEKLREAAEWWVEVNDLRKYGLDYDPFNPEAGVDELDATEEQAYSDLKAALEEK